MYEALYEQNRGLLRAMARRYTRAVELDPAVSSEDLTQAGFFGLVRAAESYDAGRGKSWAAWAVWHIREEMEQALGLSKGRIAKAHIGADTLDRQLDEDGSTALEQLADDSLPEPDSGLLLEELCRGVREAVGRLGDDRQRRVTELHQLEGLSYGETAEAMGIGIPQARQLWNRASFQLARDRELQFWAGLDARTRFHAHKGVAAFNRDWTSVTEGAALWRVEQARERAAGLKSKGLFYRADR